MECYLFQGWWWCLETARKGLSWRLEKDWMGGREVELHCIGSRCCCCRGFGWTNRRSTPEDICCIGSRCCCCGGFGWTNWLCTMDDACSMTSGVALSKRPESKSSSYVMPSSRFFNCKTLEFARWPKTTSNGCFFVVLQLNVFREYWISGSHDTHLHSPVSVVFLRIMSWMQALYRSTHPCTQGCRGDPWTMLHSPGHELTIATISALTNSVPLSECRICGKPK